MASVKEKTEKLLRERRGRFISGEEIAETLGVSRTAVWKAIDVLKEDGFKVESVTNKGYRFTDSGDVITADGIKEYLPDRLREKITAEILPETDSTNTFLRKRAVEGAKEGYLVAACKQNGGKGRLGRNFFSPDNTGIYMSLLLKPAIKPEKSVLITTAAAVAVCRVLEKLGAENPQIKWVNDVFLNGKKICGILTEGSFNMESGELDYAVLGVGVNMYRPKDDFPEDIKDIAGFVFEEEKKDGRNKFIAFFLEEFFRFYKNLESNPHGEEYAKRNFIADLPVTVISGDKKRDAYALGIGENCSLKVRYSDGTTENLSSGEISVRAK